MMMASSESLDQFIGPVDLLNDTLERAWFALCEHYDVIASLPDMKTLFYQTNLADPDKTARMVLTNMLSEVIESIGRFSPWYTKPARAFGLVSVQSRFQPEVHWMIAPEAVHQWRSILDDLACVIDRYSGLIRALVLVDDLMDPDMKDPDQIVIASCMCNPPNRIQIPEKILQCAEIVCEECQQRYA